MVLLNHNFIFTLAITHGTYHTVFHMENSITSRVNRNLHDTRHGISCGIYTTSYMTPDMCSHDET